ncbi:MULTISPECIES: pheST operon leader peptide PheM [Limnobaculum]|uniref:pheST attenuator peptide n=2 Tax=Limnobaculum TaxID=2172100 RepID=A0A9X1SLY8_9GAMM|nr:MULTISPECIES: pheST operon leader peptide PheM [Limnobaculum]MBK5142184.1 pheST operon leader peptide PheM [Limnobaculum allomyrinae]MBV7690932.1 pheST operon leader peptide PheM [Limnobaculum sp. M2-1]MCD1126739.1 pheST operon leader peptide PheM [Limnobaculum eriocheiris]
MNSAIFRFFFYFSS